MASLARLAEFLFLLFSDILVSERWAAAWTWSLQKLLLEQLCWVSLRGSFLFSSVLSAVGGFKAPGAFWGAGDGPCSWVAAETPTLVFTGCIGVGGACRRDGISCL